MTRLNNLQLSLFGNFENIKLGTEVVIKLLTALQQEQFIPGSADIASVDIKTGKVTVDSRMQLISPDKTWTIVFLGDRIDFNYSYQENTKVYKNVEQVIAVGKNLIEQVFKVCTNAIGNRLAVNGRFVVEGLSESERKTFCDKFTKPFSVFKEEAYAEWGVRFNSRTKMKIDDSTELCNRIVEMSQLERNDVSNGQIKLVHAIVVAFDVNTAQVDVDKTFEYRDLLLFAENSSEFITNVFKEIEE